MLNEPTNLPAGPSTQYPGFPAIPSWDNHCDMVTLVCNLYEYLGNHLRGHCQGNTKGTHNF